jgi:nucleoid-associated protein YgaU
MARIISVLFVLISSVLLAAHAAPAKDTSLELAENAPSRHVVVPGDTLWGISASFLKDPYRWNELWKLNPDEVKNPHRIYPGQVLVLDTSSGQPRLSIEGGGGAIPTVKVEPRVRITDQAQEIPAIPQQVIEPFLSQPLIADEDALESAPRIVAIQNDQVYAAEGSLAYVNKIASGTVRQWQIYRPGDAIKDPRNGEVIGYEAMLLGTAKLVKQGEPATIQLLTTKREIGKDDRLVPAPRPDIVNYPLHKPTAAIDSRVVSIYGGSTAGGRYSIVAISGGKVNGIEMGHVLALSRTGQLISDRYRGDKLNVTLPNERYGLVYVFRIFDKVSYALIMGASQAVEVGDTISTP